MTKGVLSFRVAQAELEVMTGARMEQAQSRVQVVGTPSSHCNLRRGFRCPALAPVIEHHETPEEPSSLKCAPVEAACAPQACNARKKSKLRVLWKLRDSYVKLLNDVACGTSSSGMPSFHGLPVGAESAAFHARLRRQEEEEQARLQVMLLQQEQDSRIFTGAFV